MRTWIQFIPDLDGRSIQQFLFRQHEADPLGAIFLEMYNILANGMSQKHWLLFHRGEELEVVHIH